MSSSSRSAPKLRPWFVIVSVGMLWLATAVATLVVWPIYQSPGILLVAAVATVLGTAIAVIGAFARWSSLPLLLVGVLVFLGIVVPLAVPAQALGGLLPTVDGLRDAALATALGWKQLLTISLPVGSYQALLVPALIVYLLSATIGVSIALRARLGEFAVLGPIGVHLFGLFFGSETAPTSAWISLGFVSVVLLWLAWRRWHRRRETLRLHRRRASDDSAGSPRPDTVTAVPSQARSTRNPGPTGLRGLLAATALLAVASVASTAAAAALPVTETRTVLRSTVVQPFDPRDYVSPLSAFRAYHNAPTDVIVQVTGLPAGTRIRLATLDSYDGVVYALGSDEVDSASGSFTRLPYRIDHPGQEGRRVTIGVRIAELRGVWLPTVGALEEVSFTGTRAAELRDSFYFNATSSSAVSTAGVFEGDEYTLEVLIPRQPAEAALASATPGDASVPPLGFVPDELGLTLDAWVRDVTTPGGRLLAMLAGMRSTGYLSHGTAGEVASRSGHAADRITELFTSQRMIGDEEQYAVTAALMARQLGFPARVVVGFAPQIVPGTATTVQGSDATAWVEVNTAEYGWVAIDPTPPLRTIPEEEPEDPAQVARPQTPVTPPLMEPEPREDQLPPDSEQEQADQPNPLLMLVLRALLVLGIAIVVLLVLALPFLVIAAAKARRRRLRRRASTPLQRIAGGWQEFADAVIDHGYDPGPAPTRLELARVVGGTQPLVLAAVIDREIFGPDLPDAATADQLWRSVDELRASLDDPLTILERLKALVSLRSLGGYSVSTLLTREKATSG